MRRVFEEFMETPRIWSTLVSQVFVQHIIYVYSLVLIRMLMIVKLKLHSTHFCLNFFVFFV